MVIVCETKLSRLECNHLQKICQQTWYQALIRTEVWRKTIQKRLSSFLGPKLQQWHRKLFTVGTRNNKMSRSAATSEETEKGSDVDETNRHNTDLYVPVQPTQWPIVYAPEYNIGFLGLERLHPFDAGKWGKVYNFLKEEGMIRDDTTIRPREATEEDLRVVHSKRYINSLKWSIEVAGITEVPPVAILPNFIVQRKVLRPFRYQTGGTILAAKLAMDRGWGINIGGGFHHCSSERGGGFCAYADITLAIKFLFERNPNVKKAMIIDLDAHQGNGHERDFMDDSNVYIMDVYNRSIYPHDGYAKRAIKRKIELYSYIADAEYLELVKTHIEGSLNEFTPDIIVYNAGTDILEGDPLGHLSITPNGIIERDQIVFENARRRKIPIMMVTSGGYQRTTARIIADSIRNLQKKKLISCDEAENAPAPKPVEKEKRSLGIPRSQSESGLFAKIRNFCFSKSPTQENIPPSADTNILDIPNLSSTKSASDLNLPVQTTSERITEESAIDFVEEKVVEQLGIDFMAKKIESTEVTEEEKTKDLRFHDNMNHDIDNSKDTTDAYSKCNVENTNDSVKKLIFTIGDNENKGARPKTGGVSVSLSDENLVVRENTSEYHTTNNKNVKQVTVDSQQFKTNKSEITVALDSGEYNETKQEILITVDTALDSGDSVDGCDKAKENFRDTVAFPQSFNTRLNAEVTSDVLNNNVRVTAAGELTAVTPDSGEDRFSGNVTVSSGGEASDDEWSDFVVYNPDKIDND